MTITFSAIYIPTIITALCFLVVAIFSEKETGMFAGLGSLLMMIPALFVSLFAWIIYAICK